MQNDIVSSVEKLNKTLIESAKRLGEINLRTLERLTETQLAVASDYLEGSVRQLKVLGESRDVQGTLAAEAKLATDLGEKFIEHAKRTAEIFTETRNELGEWVEEGFKAAAEGPLTTVAKKTTVKKAA